MDHEKNFKYFIFFSILTLTISYLPSLFINKPLNEDESINLAEALGLLHIDFIPWKKIDIFTTGPLHIYSFLIPAIFGFEPDFVNIRMVWIAFSILSILFLTLSINNFFGKKIATLTSAYIVLLISFAPNIYFGYFYNEVISIFLLAVALYYLSKKYNHQKFRPAFFLILGLIPFAKLQAAPMAVVIGIYYFYLHLNQTKKIFNKDTILGIAFGILPTILLSIFLIYNHTFSDFLDLYIFTNFSYGTQVSIFKKFAVIFLQRQYTLIYISIFLRFSILIFTLIVLICYLVNKQKQSIYLFFVVLSVATIYSISKPGFGYPHYFSYLLIPFFIGLSIIIGFILKDGQKLKSTYYIFYLVAILIMPAIGFGKFNGIQIPNSYPSLYQSELSKELIKKSETWQRKPLMVVFGWRPRLHIETGFLQGVHQNVPERLFAGQTSETGASKRNRQKYLDEIKVSKPEFFLVETNTKESTYDFRMNALKKLNDIYNYFSANYIFYKTIEDYDIYIRKDVI